MSAGDPRVRQVRRVVIQADGSGAYEITTTVIDKGDLPTPHLFVVTIVDPLDPREDVLARIATPADLRRLETGWHIRVDRTDLIYIAGDPFARVASLDELTTTTRSRADAVHAGKTEYLTSTVRLLYTDATTAEAAYRQLLARLSALVTAWRTFTSGVTAFVTTPSTTYDLPAGDIGERDVRIAAYRATVTERERIEGEQRAAETAWTACQSASEADRAVHALLAEDVSFLDRARTRVTALASGDAKDFALGAGAFASDPDTYAAWLTTRRTQLATYAATLRTRADACVALRDALDARNLELARALDAERRALAAVREVCPAYTPST